MKRILVRLIITTAAVLAAGIAWAAWSAHSAPGTAASAKAPTMPAGPMPTVNVSGANVAVSFSQTSLGSSQVGSLSGGGYLVKRYTSGGTAQTVGTSCNTIVSGTSAMLSCTENAVPDGSWLYGVTPAVGNWRGAEGTRVAATVDTTAPLVAINAVTTPTNNSKPSFSGGYGVASGDNAAVTVTVYRGAGTGGTVVATPTATLDTVAHTWSTAALASALSPDGS